MKFTKLYYQSFLFYKSFSAENCQFKTKIKEFLTLVNLDPHVALFPKEVDVCMFIGKNLNFQKSGEIL